MLITFTFVSLALALEVPVLPTAPRTGVEIVQRQCGLCHGPGIGGAPKIGDRGAWNKRLSKGLDGLTQSAAAGRGGMPPRGGLSELSDGELRAAIANMLHASGASGGEVH